MRWAVLVVAATGLVGAPPAWAELYPCTGDTEADQVAQQPGPLLRYGITPRVQAGQVGPTPAPAVPEDPNETNKALERLRPTAGPFVVRLNRFFWSDGQRGIQEMQRLTERYTSLGYLVEYQLRYHPRPEQEGDIGAWTDFVRKVVRTFGPNPRAVALQVTNEVNFALSPDSSDGAYAGARDALIQGVIAAKDEARKWGYDQLEIGFNWFYRTDPVNETSFWTYLRDHGGARFLGSLDWIGLDAYPGTFFPPVEPTLEDYRDGMVNGMSALRCYAAVADIPGSVPMHVEENGWPTPPGRDYETQAAVLRTMVQAVHDFRGTYNVADYRWFNLRDADSDDPALAQHYGLMESDYSEKPAFGVYESMVDALSAGQ